MTNPGEEGKEERLIKLRDTGDENEMVVVREEEKKETQKMIRRRF